MVRRSKPGGSEVLVTDHTAVGATYLSVKWAPGFFLRDKSIRDLALTTYLHLAPRLKKE
jgi:hypothetical protein